ncbi:unnamed protein product [Nippostrongylus brasiliensis]|uniref:Secreted protein n=1 Tax=Nippostrongylus brasiliensis TaxID=27835 RepID=A0A0N4YPR9_NIPBR|nr:unnamed protein product [Nippostrongylus brasiliensis]
MEAAVLVAFVLSIAECLAKIWDESLYSNEEDIGPPPFLPEFEVRYGVDEIPRFHLQWNNIATFEKKSEYDMIRIGRFYEEEERKYVTDQFDSPLRMTDIIPLHDYNSTAKLEHRILFSIKFNLGYGATGGEQGILVWVFEFRPHRVFQNA